MEDIAMKKRAYEQPSVRVVELQHKTNILVSSPGESTPPEDAPEYDDYLG